MQLDCEPDSFQDLILPESFRVSAKTIRVLTLVFYETVMSDNPFGCASLRLVDYSFIENSGS